MSVQTSVALKNIRYLFNLTQHTEKAWVGLETNRIFEVQTGLKNRCGLHGAKMLNLGCIFLLQKTLNLL